MKGFTAEEMKWCPPMFNGQGAMFLRSEIDGQVLLTIGRQAPRPQDSFKCDPEARMRAICKMLFDLHTDSSEIVMDDRNKFHVVTPDNGYAQTGFSEISINPFLHTDRTEITREELGL